MIIAKLTMRCLVVADLLVQLGSPNLQDFVGIK
jgi:hypothetical protein